MLPEIMIEREEDGKLKAQVWHFAFDDDFQLHLSRYFVLERATRRHGYKVITRYSVSDYRNDTINLPEIPLPQDVAEEAIYNFTKRIKVTKEFGR